MSDPRSEIEPLRERIIELARRWDEESVEPAEDFADALLDLLGLERHAETWWSLYNAEEQAIRMMLGPHNGVRSIEEARERMAPYHPGGQGYEVIERTQVWWSTASTFTPLPAAQSSSRPSEPVRPKDCTCLGQPAWCQACIDAGIPDYFGSHTPLSD